MNTDIQNQEFKVHKLTDVGLENAKALAVHFDALLKNILEITGTDKSREISLVRTKLEEACFFAKKALAQNEMYQADSDWNHEIIKLKG